MNRITTALLVLFLFPLACPEASALITGGEGNTPITDPGWPRGAGAIFNHPGRVAWWEGPPFGGGQWHAESRSDTATLNGVLADFARLDSKAKRIVIHDGTGQSFWLSSTNDPEKMAHARVDWVFTVWVPASWESLRKLPADFNPTDPTDTSPPASLDVYVGGLRWPDVKLPEGIAVEDRRSEAHGFTAADGLVLEGNVTDLATKQPLVARVRLQRVETPKGGGYQYPDVTEVKTDERGHWVLKHAPTGWIRVVVEANGFVPRIAGYTQHDHQPRWDSHDCGLTRAALVSGRVLDDAGQPLADVAVQFLHVSSESGGRYKSPEEGRIKTDAQGRFRSDQLPGGKATVWVNKPGYVRPGLGLPIVMPTDNIELRMGKSASIRVTVDFADAEPPSGYMVKMEPEGGEVVGSFGGSSQIDTKRQVLFENIPPGRYLFIGHPNPSTGDQRTKPVTVDLKGGQAAEIILKAR